MSLLLPVSIACLVKCASYDVQLIRRIEGEAVIVHVLGEHLKTNLKYIYVHCCGHNSLHRKVFLAQPCVGIVERVIKF